MKRDIITSQTVAEYFLNKSDKIEKSIRLTPIDLFSIEMMRTVKNRTLSFHWASVHKECRDYNDNNNFEVAIWAEDNDIFYFCGVAIGKNTIDSNYCSIDFIEKVNEIPEWIRGKLSYVSLVCLNSLALVSKKENLRLYNPNSHLIAKLKTVLSNRSYSSGHDDNGEYYVEFSASLM